MSSTEQQGWLLLTNDDGIEAPGFRLLIQALNNAGHSVVAFAPHENNSAAGMRINLGTPMELRPRDDLVDTWELDTEKAGAKLFELQGTPCDTMIVALDGGLEHVVPGIRPRLVVSGVNLGPNMSQDSYHSGTMGWPEIPEHPAWEHDPKSALRTAFQQGELMLNLNVPPGWNGQVTTTRLGMRWYRDAVSFSSIETDEAATFTIGAASIDHSEVDQSDCDVVAKGKASVSCLPVWPQTHPLALDDRLLTWALQSCEGGYPAWLYD